MDRIETYDKQKNALVDDPSDGDNLLVWLGYLVVF
jgi:hypothetical protein